MVTSSNFSESVRPLYLCPRHPTVSVNAMHYILGLFVRCVSPFIRSSGQILSPEYLQILFMNISKYVLYNFSIINTTISEKDWDSLFGPFCVSQYFTRRRRGGGAEAAALGWLPDAWKQCHRAVERNDCWLICCVWSYRLYFVHVCHHAGHCWLPAVFARILCVCAIHNYRFVPNGRGVGTITFAICELYRQLTLSHKSVTDIIVVIKGNF